MSLVSVPRTAGIGATSPLTMASAGVGSPPLLLFDWRGKRRPRPAVDPEEGVRFLPRVANRVDVAIILSPCFSAGSDLLPVRANVSGAARRLSGPRITKPLPFAETRAKLLDRSPIKEPRRMQFEIPEDAHVHIFIGKPTLRDFSLASCSAGTACAGLDRVAAGALLAVPGDAAVRPAPRFGRLLLKGSLGVILLAASFVVGQHFTSPSSAPELARTAAALPRPAPLAEQHAFPDSPQSREPLAQTAGEVTTNFQKQLQQPPTVIPPPGQTGAPGTPGKNPFGLEN